MVQIRAVSKQQINCRRFTEQNTIYVWCAEYAMSLVGMFLLCATDLRRMHALLNVAEINSITAFKQILALNKVKRNSCTLQIVEVNPYYCSCVDYKTCGDWSRLIILNIKIMK